MNKLLFLALIFSVGLPGVPAQQASTTSVARENFIDRSSQELRILRQQIETAYQQTPLSGQAGFAPSLNAIAAAENALAEYKIAPENDRTVRRAAFEHAKAKAVQLWTDFRAAISTHSSTSETPMADRAP